MEPTPAPNGYPIAAMVAAIARDVRKLARLEASLAKQEMATKARETGIGIGLALTAVLIGVFAIGTLVAAAVLGLSEAIPAWLAALVVGLVLVGISAVLVLVARRRLRESMPPTPEQAISSSKETVRWAQRKMRSASRSS